MSLRWLRPLHRPRAREFAISLALVGSLWGLGMVFWVVLPAIPREVVRSSDRVVLERVGRLAVWAAIWSAASAGLGGATLGAVCASARCRRGARGGR
jgi:hypothetical protein